MSCISFIKHCKLKNTNNYLHIFIFILGLSDFMLVKCYCVHHKKKKKITLLEHFQNQTPNRRKSLLLTHIYMTAHFPR